MGATVPAGTWVEIERVLLRPEERAANLPEDTAKTPYLLRLSGFLVNPVEIGSTHLTLRELLALGESSVIELDRQANELLDVFVNGTLIGRGEVVTVGDRFGVRMTELVSPEKWAAR